ncbi:MAG TPA: response regulator [Herpetosiphonaceae bacterium]
MPSPILVVDDEAPIVAMIEEVLLDEGYAVVTALSGERALALLDDARPALILCDVMMPGIGGVELCQRLRADPRWSTIPVILISAAKEADALREACEYAAFLSKPFALDALLATIAAHLPVAADTGC